MIKLKDTTKTYWFSRFINGALGSHEYHKCSISHELDINGHTNVIDWQNGHSYVGNDYNYPSNSFNVYRDNTTGHHKHLINELYGEDEVDQSVVDSINEDWGTHYTLEEAKEVFNWLETKEPNIDGVFSDDMVDYEEYGDFEDFRIKDLPEGWELG